MHGQGSHTVKERGVVRVTESHPPIAADLRS